MSASRRAFWKWFGMLFIGLLLMNWGFMSMSFPVRSPSKAPAGATPQEIFRLEKADEAHQHFDRVRNLSIGLTMIMVGTVMMTLAIRRRVFALPSP